MLDYVGLRLNQAVAASGLCSRKAAARLISAGQVLVNQQPHPHHYLIKAGDVIVVNGQELAPPPPRQYWIYHKPVGIDCNLNAQDPASLYHILQQLPVRLFPFGRLDKDSSGLLILSNDGELAQRLMHNSSAHTKHYEVTVAQPITAQQLMSLATGVQWVVGPHRYIAKPCPVTAINAQQFRIILTEGQNRQIRYMCRSVGLKVIGLKRLQINQLVLNEAVGELRPLTNEEWHQLVEPAVAGKN